MANKKKSSKVLALVLAVIMLLSVIPASIFAADELGTLRDGKAAISSDMTVEQIKEVLFNTLVKDRDGKDAQSLEWEYYGSAKSSPAYNSSSNWGSIDGFTFYEKHGLINYTYNVPALKDAGNGEYQVRLAGTTEEVTLTKVSSCTVNFDYDVTMGDVKANGSVVVGEKTGYTPKSSIILTVAPKAGYVVESVTVNGETVIANEEGVYEFLPIADTVVAVSFVEAGTFHDLVIPEVEGVSIKVNGFDAKGTVRVNNDEDTVIEYITDANTSIDVIKMNDVDVTANAEFADYNATQTLKVTEDTEIAVETIKTDIVKSGETVIPVTANADSSWNMAEIEKSIIDIVVGKDSTVYGKFDYSEMEVMFDARAQVSTGANWKYLDVESSTFVRSFREAYEKSGSVNIWIGYKGNAQYRPTDRDNGGIYETITMDNLPKANIAVRSGVQTFTLYTNPDHSFNYEQLRKDIYKAVIDEAGTTPAGAISYDKVTMSYWLTDDIGGGFGDAGEYHPFEKDSSGWDSGNTFKYLYKGGTFKIKVALPDSDKYYGTSVEFDVNVEVAGLPTGKVVVKDGAPTALNLYRKFDRTYDYAALRQEIFDKVIEVKGLPDDVELTVDNFEFLRYTKAYSGNYVTFEGDSKFDEMSKSGEGIYQMRVVLKTGEGYIGSSVDFDMDISFVDDSTAQIVINDGPFAFDLNENGIDAYDYDALKQAIFAGVIKEVKNVPADLAWDDFTYTYETMKAMGSVFMAFETRGGDLGDAAEIARNYLHKGGKQTIKVTLPDGEDYYGAEVTFEITVNVQGLPNVAIKAAEGQSVVLNRLKTGNPRPYDYAELKQNIFNLLTIENAPVDITVDDLTFERWANGYVDASGFKYLDAKYVPFEGMNHPLAGAYYQNIGDAGEGVYKIKVTLPNSDKYYGTELEFELTITFYDAYITNIALKENYNEVYTLNYKTVDEFDYDRLKKEIFENVIDTANSSANVTFENAQFTYQLFNAMGTSDTWSGNFHPFEIRKPDFDKGETYKYLYKGGNFNVKIYFPTSNGLYANEVIVSLNIGPYGRVESVVRMNENVTMDFNKDVDAVKQYVFDNVISWELSTLPDKSTLTLDDFSFEYWAEGWYDVNGLWWKTEARWVPFEGMEHPTMAGGNYPPIYSGKLSVRVRYKGNTEYTPFMPTEGFFTDFTINKAPVEVSLNQNYIYVGNELNGDILNVNPSTANGINKFFFTLRTDSIADDSYGVINVQTSYGLKETDLTVLASPMFSAAIGRDGTSVLTDGVSREELIKLVNSDAFEGYLKKKYIDDTAIAAIRKFVAEQLPAGMEQFYIYAGTPGTPGTYKMIAVTGDYDYQSGVVQSDFYVKYNSKGWKLNWVADTAGLKAIKAPSFDFRAVVTKDGVPQNSSHVKYIYTGFQSNFLFYGSTTKAPTKAGIYTQTAWTGISGHYCFPKTRTFTISLL